jgi:hypothetical protein
MVSMRPSSAMRVILKVFARMAAFAIFGQNGITFPMVLFSSSTARWLMRGFGGFIDLELILVPSIASSF